MKLEDKKQKEFLEGKKLSRTPQLFHFSQALYQRVFELVCNLEHYTAPTQNHSQPPCPMYYPELKKTFRYHFIFSHSCNSRYTPTQLHGSLGLASPLVLKNLPKQSNFYFDVLFTAITHAIFQYQDIGLVRCLNQPYHQLPAIEQTRQSRKESNISPPRIELIDMPKEELMGRFATPRNRVVISSGEHVFSLPDDNDYVIRAKSIGAPYLTGISSNAYIIFKCLGINLQLNLNELIQLRLCLVAYMLAAHDHTLIEVLDGINFALAEQDFNAHFNFDTRQLIIQPNASEDYSKAMEEIFNVSCQNNKTIIQLTILDLISQDKPAAWMRKILSTRIAQYLKHLNKARVNDQATVLEVETRLLTILNQLSVLDPNLMRLIFNEDQKESCITHIDAIVDLYCAARCSLLPLKLLMGQFYSNGTYFSDGMTKEEAIARRALIQNFGFSTTRHGPAFIADPLCKCANQPTESYVGLPAKATCDGSGAILCTKGYTPLLNMIWMLGSTDSRQDFHLIKSNDAPLFTADELHDSENNSPSMLAYELYFLFCCGYTLIKHNDQGLTFVPSKNDNSADLPAICNGLAHLKNICRDHLTEFFFSMWTTPTDKSKSKSPEAELSSSQIREVRC